MRRTISLSGRRKLDLNNFDLSLDSGEFGTGVSLSVTENFERDSYSATSVVRVRLSENRRFVAVDFGPPHLLNRNVPVFMEIPDIEFHTPSYEITVVEKGGESYGKVLASTESRRYYDNLNFGADGLIKAMADTSLGNRVWALDLSGAEFPVLRVNGEIPSVLDWVSSNPVFQACVLPDVLKQVTSHVLETDEFERQPWHSEWMEFLRTIRKFGSVPTDPDGRDSLIDELTDGFLGNFRFVEKIASSVEH